ncbi:MAG: hypothetical protein KBS53_01525 [Bacteroidales bacterium]|nr:hypothetical protein [Candidatus Hennigimonas equi]
MKLFNILLALLCAVSLSAQENAPSAQDELLIRQNDGREIYDVISNAGHGFNQTERALSNSFVKEFLSECHCLQSYDDSP